MKTFRRKYVKPAPRPLNGVPYMYQIQELLGRVVPGYGIKDHEGRGLHLTVGDYTLSLQWASHNYCSNSQHGLYTYPTNAPLTTDFELAIWETGSKAWVKLNENDDVLGHVCWEKLETILTLVKLKHFDDIRVAAYQD